jgi:hypothetical protein
MEYGFGIVRAPKSESIPIESLIDNALGIPTDSSRAKFALIAENYGKSLTIPTGYTDLLSQIATTRVRPLLSLLVQDREYEDKVKEENLSFLRTDNAFEKCMKAAYQKWGWVHKKLGQTHKLTVAA